MLEKIEEKFQLVFSKNFSGWALYNGAKSYDMCYLNDVKTILELITQNPHQKEFNILDIGAGNFQWSKSIQTFLNNSDNLTDTVKLNIISIRGERSNEPEIVYHSKIILYTYGGFKIENILDSFVERGLNFSNWSNKSWADLKQDYCQYEIGHYSFIGSEKIFHWALEEQVFGSFILHMINFTGGISYGPCGVDHYM